MRPIKDGGHLTFSLPSIYHFHPSGGCYFAERPKKIAGDDEALDIHSLLNHHHQVIIMALFFFFASLISFDFPTSWLPEALCVGSTGRFRRWNGPERVHLIPSHRPPPSLIAPAAGRRRYAGIPVALPSSGGSPQRLETKDFLLIISRVNSFKEEKVWAGKNSSLFACSTRKNRFSGARQNKHKIRQQKETELEHEARGIWNSGGRNNTAPTESRRGN